MKTYCRYHDLFDCPFAHDTRDPAQKQEKA